MADLVSRDAAVRNAAIALLATAHRQLGPGLADMVRPDVKPALMASLDEAFARNPQQQVGIPDALVTKARIPGDCCSSTYLRCAFCDIPLP